MPELLLDAESRRAVPAGERIHALVRPDGVVLGVVRGQLVAELIRYRRVLPSADDGLDIWGIRREMPYTVRYGEVVYALGGFQFSISRATALKFLPHTASLLPATPQLPAEAEQAPEPERVLESA